MVRLRLRVFIWFRVGGLGLRLRLDLGYKLPLGIGFVATVYRDMVYVWCRVLGDE